MPEGKRSERVFLHEVFIGKFWRKKTSPEAGFFSLKEIIFLALQQQEPLREQQLQQQELQQALQLQQQELQEQQQELQEQQLQQQEQEQELLLF